MSLDDMINNTNTSNDKLIDDLLSNPFNEEPEVTKEPTLEESNFQINEVESEQLIDRLPEHRQQQARELASKIDENELFQVSAYGSKAQEKLSEFSRTVLNRVQMKDLGEIGDVLQDLMSQLNATNPTQLEDKGGMFQKLFGKVKHSILETQQKYQKLGAQIDRISLQLEREQKGLLEDNAMLETLYHQNKEFFDALNVYIAAGEVKMKELQEITLPNAIKKAEETGSQMDVQIVDDLNQFLNRLDKRVHDLRLTRQMTIQQAPQIRMIQNTNQSLAEKIHASIHTAIPLWENQLTIAMALLRQNHAIDSQRAVTQTTNELLRKNSDMLKQGAVETAKESERGVIDLETLQYTQQNLVDTLEETLAIQEEGRLKRRQAEHELNQLEDELKHKLLDFANHKRAPQAYQTTSDQKENLLDF